MRKSDAYEAIPFSVKIKRKKKVTTKRIASEAF